MKKYYSGFLMGMMICLWITSYAETETIYPIPSFNVIVNGNANFQEASLKGGSVIDGRKKVQVYNSFSKSGDTPSTITVYVYSLDGQDILGPYYPASGTTLTVEIDDRLWGVLVQSASEVEVDVWIEEPK